MAEESRKEQMAGTDKGRKLSSFAPEDEEAQIISLKIR